MREISSSEFLQLLLRDMSLASLELALGGGCWFSESASGFTTGCAMLDGTPTALGIIMFAALPILVGLQLLLAFLAYDIASVPRNAIAQDLPDPTSDDVH